MNQRDKNQAYNYFLSGSKLIHHIREYYAYGMERDERKERELTTQWIESEDEIVQAGYKPKSLGDLAMITLTDSSWHEDIPSLEKLESLEPVSHARIYQRFILGQIPRREEYSGEVDPSLIYMTFNLPRTNHLARIIEMYSILL